MAYTDSTRKTGLWMILTAFALLLGLLTFFFDKKIEQEENPNYHLQSFETANTVEVLVHANRQHHYLIPGKINDMPVTFLVDTGATQVSIPFPIAQQLQLPRMSSAMANTANGAVEIMLTKLNTLDIGAIHMTNVTASINPSMRTDEVLLGMSALKALHFEVQAGTMRIIYYKPVEPNDSKLPNR